MGDLAIVLHSHMPYVEGFGTYPFGEEWLFDAVARSYLPVLDVAEQVTVGVTPVLADQLEAGAGGAGGVTERMLAFLREHRLGAAERDAEEAGSDELGAAARSEAARYRTAIDRLEAAGGDALAPFRAAADSGRVELIASAATHAVLPKLATREARRLQIDAGLRSHARRFGEPAGFWLPECAYRPGLEALLAERGIAYTCVDQSAVEEPLAALAPASTPAGPVAFTIDWPSVRLLWSDQGYPSRPAYTEYYRFAPHGTRLWAVEGGPLDPAAAQAQAESDADEFLEAVGARLRRFAAERGRRGLIVFAIDTELLGLWWSQGAEWLAAVLGTAAARGVRLLTLSEALERHEPEGRELLESSWGESKDLSTWDSPEIADLVWGARRLELGLLHRIAARTVTGAAAERAARELLAVQASDWAFLDKRRQAGDYPYRRAITHAASLLEALDSAEPPDPRMRNLAPDMILAPLLEP